MTRIGRKRRQRRDAVLAAARALVTARGVEGLTVNRLADALDYTPGALYRYFPSKEAILATLEAESATAVAEGLRTELAAWEAAMLEGDARVGALGALVIAADFYRSLAWRMPADHLLLSELTGHPRALVDPASAQVTIGPLTALLGMVTAALEGAASVGALDGGDSPRRAILFWSSLTGVLQTRKLGRYAPALFDEKALTTALVDALLRSFGADAATLANARAHAAAHTATRHGANAAEPIPTPVDGGVR